jgi:hypothetical protein
MFFTYSLAMDNFERIFGFPNAKTPVDVSPDKNYGLVIYVSEWRYWTGSFAYIFGVYTGYHKAIEDTINVDIPLYTAFYELDNYKPVQIIDRAVCSDVINTKIDGPHPEKRNIVRADLTSRVLNAYIPPVDLDRFED